MSTRCPICNGAGRIPDPKATKRSERNVRAAALLNEAGYSLREISSLLGYKSSRSAAVLISKATEALAALSELDAQPSAPTVDQITLEGEQSDPCGTITVKVRMSDGREVEAIRTNANSIYHMVTVADPAFGK